MGAVLVRGGLVLAADGNRTLLENDPTGHAEMRVIRAGLRGARQAQRLPDCDLYVTLEPCAMCAARHLIRPHPPAVFRGADPKGGAVEHGPRFFGQPTCHHRPDGLWRVPGARSRERMLRAFFDERR